ncbi:hypothetical protein CEXT_553331 [Caerostris extrusa]|uniref:Uncharacterized protein n=1 Tax=Caerostris extrusa TaxID=172846 RepID=A0AAV4XSL4_CAEEX|nr:hypothetical protein CEXT_553331 [Caerostris extrusa]
MAWSTIIITYSGCFEFTIVFSSELTYWVQLLQSNQFKKMHTEYDIDASSLNLIAANSSLLNIAANLTDMLQGLIYDQKYTMLDSFTNILVSIGILTFVIYFFTYILFTERESTHRKLLVLENFLGSSDEDITDAIDESLDSKSHDYKRILAGDFSIDMGTERGRMIMLRMDIQCSIVSSRCPVVDTDFDIILEDILYKEVLKIYNMEKNKKSSAATKSKSNTKDIDYKLSDVSVCDPSNSREGQNDTDFDIKIEDILYKELIKIYSIEWNKESSATTKSKSNTKDIDYKLSDVTIGDPRNSREGQNGVYV